MYVRSGKTKEERRRIIMEMIEAHQALYPKIIIKKTILKESNSQKKPLYNLKSKDSENIKKT